MTLPTCASSVATAFAYFSDTRATISPGKLKLITFPLLKSKMVVILVSDSKLPLLEESGITRRCRSFVLSDQLPFRRSEAESGRSSI